MMKTIEIVIFSMLVIGCASYKPMPTTSGRPEVLAKGMTKKQVTDRLLEKMTDNRYRLKSESDNRLIFERPADSMAAGLIYGSRYDLSPNARVSYTLLQSSDSVRIIGDIDMVTNPGSGVERTTDLSSTKDGGILQTKLDQWFLAGDVIKN